MRHPHSAAAAPIVVVPNKTERFTADGFPFSMPAQQQGGLPAPVVKRLAADYPEGIRLTKKEMKPYEARLERSATLPKYDITIKPKPTVMQEN